MLKLPPAVPFHKLPPVYRLGHQPGRINTTTHTEDLPLFLPLLDVDDSGMFAPNE